MQEERDRKYVPNPLFRRFERAPAFNPFEAPKFVPKPAAEPIFKEFIREKSPDPFRPSPFRPMPGEDGAFGEDSFMNLMSRSFATLQNYVDEGLISNADIDALKRIMRAPGSEKVLDEISKALRKSRR